MKYRFTIEFDAEDDEDACVQVWGDPETGEDRYEFHSIYDEKLVNAGTGAKVS